jgi:hypothetical protein
MEDPVTDTKLKPGLVTLIAGGCLAVLYTVFCALALAVGSSQVASRNSPTSTPTVTPVPQVLVHTPSDPGRVIHEDFSSDKNLWGMYYENGKLEIINGRMVLQSGVTNGIEVGTSRKLAPTGDRYYLQADLSTDTETTNSYGLVFGASQSLGTYYLFELWPQNGTYRLFKFNTGKWTELIPATPVELHPYPFSNTLSVDFDRGTIGLFVNGNLVSEYTDGDYFQSKGIGMYVNNMGYRLLVDDLFIYSEK